MESRLLQTQQFRSLASLLDNLNSLIKDWISIVSEASQDNTQDEEFQKLIEELKNFDAPLPHIAKPKESESINKDQFMDELAALSSLELPSFSDDSTTKALNDLANYTKEPSSNDLSSLKLPESFDNFFVSAKKGKKQRRVGGLGRRGGRITKKAFAGVDLDMFKNPSEESVGDDNIPIDDGFGLSSLDELTAALQLTEVDSIESPKTPARQSHTPMSYDDFFKGLNSVSENTDSANIVPPRGDNLIRAYGVRDDMNKRGMQKTKKKSKLNAHGKGIYQMEDTHFIDSPFENNPEQSLFCVFDGHVDKNCAIAATKIFPEVR